MVNMRKTITALTATALLTIPATAQAVDMEPGATFYEDGSCQEADGTPGMSQPDGQCVTIADYDFMFSYESLDATPSAIPGSDQSIAEEAGITSEDNPASERPLGEGLIEEYPTKTFANQFAPTGWERNPYSRWGTGAFYPRPLDRA